MSERRIILMDADVVSHFISGGEAACIHEIFSGHPIHMLDKVHAELQRWPSAAVRSQISELLSRGRVRLVPFPEEDAQIRREYHHIKSMLLKGDGESACMAVARYNHHIWRAATEGH